MTKPPARVPTSSILLTLLSLGIMPRPSLRTVRIAILAPVRRTLPSRRMANQQRG